MLGLTQLQTMAVVGGLIAVLVGGAFFWTLTKGEKLGESTVKAAVATETVKTLGKARTEKEKANEKARNTPIEILVDDLK